MIIRTTRERTPLFQRIFGSPQTRLQNPQVLTEQQLKVELLKEICRSDRRDSNREFALIRMTCSEQVEEVFPPLMADFQQRIRISDTIGWFEDGLAILLPETDRSGASVVASDLLSIAKDANLDLSTEISVYPWDDQMVSLSEELREVGSDDNGPSDLPGRGNDFGNESKPADSDPVESDRPAAIVNANSAHCFVQSPATPWWKRGIDIVGAGTGILFLAPLFAIAAVMIKVSSPGPVFFRQMREGKDGKPFGILKFRTMVIDAERRQADLRDKSEQDGPAFKLKNDPRVTPIGRYLRKSCIDELPQLFNVLVGQMSLVGPRPLPVVESHACKAWQRSRLTVLPGLTCIWQARGGRNVKFAEWMRMDLEYIEKRSFWFDIKLIFETAFIAVLHRGSV